MNSSAEGKAWKSSFYCFDCERELALCMQSLLSFLGVTTTLRSLSIWLSLTPLVIFWMDSRHKTNLCHLRYFWAYSVVMGILL